MLVISANPNYRHNLKTANYLAEWGGQVVGGIDRQLSGEWVADIAVPSCDGDPECGEWSDVTVVYRGADRLAAKHALKQQCNIAIASGWIR